MSGFEQPQEEQKTEQIEIDEETLREVIYNIFFKAHHPKTTQELLSRIQEQANALGISIEKLEGELMGEIGDQMANSVD